MPRISAESRGAAAFRAGGQVPEPPPTLDKDGAAVWREIAASKPADWFDPGTHGMFEGYCEATVHMRHLHKELRALRKRGTEGEQKAMEKRVALVWASMCTMATKLRLSVQANMEWHSRKIGERGAEDTASDRLLGGHAVWASQIGLPNQ